MFYLEIYALPFKLFFGCEKSTIAAETTTQRTTERTTETTTVKTEGNTTTEAKRNHSHV